MRLILPLLVLMLAACTPSEVPLTFEPLEARVEVAKMTDVRVELVQGPALPMAKLLSSAVAAGLIEHGVKTSIKDNEISRYVLKGEAKANWDDARVPFVMLIHWTLVDLKGDSVGDYTQGVRGARWKWEYGDPRIIRAVGNGAAKPLAAMIIDDVEDPLPVLLLGAGILVGPVSGAPGDGNDALRQAIVSALREADVSITEDKRQASLMLSGQVGIQSLQTNQDKILIVWRVLTMDGFEVGRATQENVVPAGSLNGPWAGQAENVAAAALIGIERILGADNKRATPSSVGQQGTPPPAPDLQRIPGRAPPPPE
ncbi:MAG: hypothetical protein HOL66_04865 [Rhodospirillaceae bacterium]|jgi:hypothetical protein|nr:hypothetical protein [Rhodospirillaceae bacterium]MBT5243554.1 hypothetical protein [Rhodospirillaceae bacterium]MBT5562142.1 hypothetical protein [Rhodospirillaceae bacterium]MBT6242315.1 hypothetical protein [Rhodospirillaceae bacterium]MBT7137673.1 hypothetical protein [Rhodospirillaceae bacterium]